MTDTMERVTCRTPAEGRGGVTNIPAWKFEAVRGAILDAVSQAGPEGQPFKGLSGEVKSRLPADTLAKLGSVGWHTTTVKLEMEVAGDIARLDGVSPQRIVLASA